MNKYLKITFDQNKREPKREQDLSQSKDIQQQCKL
jgi:hypothetical protein